MLFEQLGLAQPLLKALQTQGYTTPTPIQAQSIPVVLQNRDLLGLAQTGVLTIGNKTFMNLHRQLTGWCKYKSADMFIPFSVSLVFGKQL